MIREVPVYPQIIISESQGLVGKRAWTISQNDDLDAVIEAVCESHFPGYPDAIPIEVLAGAFFNDVIARRECSAPRTLETIGNLPTYGAYKIEATYLLHRRTNCWPANIPKPWHPVGTTLTLKIRGGGQTLLVSPAGVRAASPLLECVPGAESLSAAVGTRMVVPITEYQISCDLMTRAQVDAALGMKHWDNYQGTVNAETGDLYMKFLGKEPETLLFDGYEIQETNACHPGTTRRYRMTASLKHRVLLNSGGEVRVDCDGRPIGWNHDFVNFNGKQWGWKYMLLYDATADCTGSSSSGLAGDCVPRYRPGYFFQMFGASPGDIDSSDANQDCGSDVTESTTSIGDTYFCES